MSKFVAGRTYKTANGCDARVIATDLAGPFSMMAVINGDSYRYLPSGRLDAIVQHGLDLIAAEGASTVTAFLMTMAKQTLERAQTLLAMSTGAALLGDDGAAIKYLRDAQAEIRKAGAMIDDEA